MRYRQNTKGDILYGPPVISRSFDNFLLDPTKDIHLFNIFRLTSLYFY